mgnify:CR=1 FL=1
MKVNIRKRKTGQDKSSLNLEICINGRRTRETLNLFLYNNPKNKLEEKQDAIVTLNSILTEQNKANDTCMCYTGEKKRVTDIRQRMLKQEKYDKSK